MLVAWMVYGVVLGLLFATGALLAEVFLRSFGVASRKVWFVAMAASLVFPLIAWAGLGVGESVFALERVTVVNPLLELTDRDRPELVLLGGFLGFAWVTASTLMLLFLGMQSARVRRGSVLWSRDRIDGVDVLVSDDVGPAIVGFFGARIVLPKWALEVESGLLRLILDHEREHLEGRDPQLLLAAYLLLIAMPWNPALWWMAQRLRLAVELDCDSRVLRSGRWDVRTYGGLLLSVSGRRSRHGYSWAAFSRPRSLLERRILEMTRPAGGGLWLRRGVLAAGAAMMILGAYWLPAPDTVEELVADGFFCTPTWEHSPLDSGSRAASL